MAKKRKSKKKLTANQKAYKQIAASIRKSISRARAQGFDIKYEMHKPDIITKKYLQTLRGINLEKVRAGVDIPGLKISSYQTGTGIDLRPKKYKPEEIEEEKEERKKEEKKKPKKEKKQPEPEQKPEPIQEPEPEPESEQEPRFEFIPDQEPTQYNADYFYDTATGEKFLPGDDRIYEKDKKGRIKTDKDGNPILRDDIVPVTSAPLSASDYENLVWENLLYQFGGKYTYNSNAKDTIDKFHEWLEKMRDKYGTFALRDMLIRVQDSGAKLDRDFFYMASEQDVNTTLNRLQAMLHLGNFNYDDIVAMGEITERAEGGFYIGDTPIPN